MRKFILTFFLCGLFFSCSKDNPDTPQPESKLPIHLSMNIATRVTDSSFDTNDRIGLYVVNKGTDGLLPSGNHVDNMRFTYKDNLWTPDQTIYWKDETTPADFYCYYPYSGTIESVGSHKFTVQSDQSSEAAYKASEFLWGKKENVTPTESAVAISVKHMMSNLIVYLVPGKGYTAEDLSEAKVKVCGIAPTAQVDLATGAVTAVDLPVEIAPRAESNYFKALIVPQNIENKPLIKVTVGENTYTLTTSINFQSGMQHKCTVKVSKLSNGIHVGIDGWTSDDKDYGGDAN